MRYYFFQARKSSDASLTGASLIYTTTTSLPQTQTNPTPAPSTASSTSDSATQLWTFNLADGQVYSPIYADGYVYFKTNPAIFQGTLNCVDAQTGSLVWSISGWIQGFTVSNGYIYICAGSQLYSELPESTSINDIVGFVYCLNAHTGTQIWNYSAGQSFTTPIVAGNTVYASGFTYQLSTDVNAGFIYAFDTLTGTKLWSSIGSSGTRFDENSLAINGGKLYALSNVYSDKDASEHSGIFAFNAETGQQLWSYTASGQFSSFTVNDQIVCVSSLFVDTTGNIDAEHLAVTFTKAVST